MLILSCKVRKVPGQFSDHCSWVLATSRNPELTDLQDGIGALGAATTPFPLLPEARLELMVNIYPILRPLLPALCTPPLSIQDACLKHKPAAEK